jgi:hypothetical protein
VSDALIEALLHGGQKDCHVFMGYRGCTIECEDFVYHPRAGYIDGWGVGAVSIEDALDICLEIVKKNDVVIHNVHVLMDLAERIPEAREILEEVQSGKKKVY